MKTTLIIILIAAVIAGAIWTATKYFGLFKDQDKDGIPDAVEDAVKKGKATANEIKVRVNRVKQELKDVADAAKEVGNQAGDVIHAVKGKPRPGRKPNRRNNKGNGSSNEAQK